MTERAFIDRQQVIRRDMLAALYELRRQKKGGFVRQLTHTLGHEPNECVFALGYLIDAGCVKRQNAELRLTASGIERFEREWR